MLAAVVALAGLAAAVTWGIITLVRGDQGPSTTEVAAAADRFLEAWSAGDHEAAALATDSPAAAERLLTMNVAGLDGAAVDATLSDLAVEGERASGHVALRWDVPGIGEWRSSGLITLQRTGGRWLVRPRPQLIDHRLGPETRLGTDRQRLRRAPILDGEGNDLLPYTPVVQVGLERHRVGDPATSARALAELLDVDASALLRALKQAGRRQFVPALTLRMPAFRELAGELEQVQGVKTIQTSAPLAPTREFARALLGAVGPATAEQIEESGGRLADGDITGQWGLAQQFDEQLSGRPARRIVVRRRLTGTIVRTLHRIPGVRPRPLRTRLSMPAQAAAEHALADYPDEAAHLVAVRPSTGDVLAVANRPVDSTFNAAFSGSFPPGSTFKIVTTAALLRAGFSADSNVPCPPTLVVDGRSFRNFEGEASGTATFSEDFAISCNTAFISLAGRLQRDSLTRAARDFGLGRTLDLGVGVARSRVPVPRTDVEMAAAMIGQDRILATPVAMAGVAATVAACRWHAPRLLATDPASSGRPLPDAECSTLQRLMRQVVTTGTGVAASSPGEVAGKTGTAEYGGQVPPETHAWFVAYRDDVAIAVLVEDGSSGGEIAAPLAARFFEAYRP